MQRLKKCPKKVGVHSAISAVNHTQKITCTLAQNNIDRFIESHLAGRG